MQESETAVERSCDQKVNVTDSTYWKRVHIDDNEVQGHGEGHGSKQPDVAPWGHAHKRLVLRQALKRQE